VSDSYPILILTLQFDFRVLTSIMEHGQREPSVLLWRYSLC